MTQGTDEAGTTGSAVDGFEPPPDPPTFDDIASMRRPAPVQENPVAAVEDALRRSTVAAAKDSIWRLGALLDQSPAAAARALHLIGETAAAYGEMLAAIGVPGVRRRRDVVGTYAASASLNDSIASLDASPGGETFGNQALQQIVAAIPQIGKMIAGKRSEPRAPRGPTAFDIESLTRAYGEAKRAGLDESTVAALKAKLDEALASKQWGPPSGVDDADLGPPTADEEVTP